MNKNTITIFVCNVCKTEPCYLLIPNYNGENKPLDCPFDYLLITDAEWHEVKTEGD